MNVLVLSKSLKEHLSLIKNVQGVALKLAWAPCIVYLFLYKLVPCSAWLTTQGFH